MLGAVHTRVGERLEQAEKPQGKIRPSAQRRRWSM